MTDSRRGSGSGETPEELADALRAKARAAATTALREGLEDIDDRYGHRVADKVAGLIDVDAVFAGLDDPRTPGRRADEDDDGPYEFRPLTGL